LDLELLYQEFHHFPHWHKHLLGGQVGMIRNLLHLKRNHYSLPQQNLPFRKNKKQRRNLKMKLLTMKKDLVTKTAMRNLVVRILNLNSKMVMTAKSPRKILI